MSSPSSLTSLSTSSAGSASAENPEDEDARHHARLAQLVRKSTEHFGENQYVAESLKREMAGQHSRIKLGLLELEKSGALADKKNARRANASFKNSQAGREQDFSPIATHGKSVGFADPPDSR